jgi:NADH-quinone oxidoreductase subunit C
MINVADLVEKLNIQFEDELELSENGQAIYVVKKQLLKLLQILKEEFNYRRLTDITSVDYEDRYEVVYHLFNDEGKLLSTKVKLEKNDNSIPSIVSIWKSANEQEREVYDLMGITFEGHKNLKRILCPDDFVGHPLQKSFKLDIVKRFNDK